MTQSGPITRTRQDLINTGEALGKSPGAASGAHEPPEQAVGIDDYKSSGKKRLSEFCYSISNLVIIVAAVIALCVLIKFIQDDPLYKYGEHLLSLYFYGQLIFILVILPLVLLLPVFNALSALLLSARAKQSETLLKLKLAYQLLMFLLVLVALVFVAPYIRATNLSGQLELEFRKHMKYRYEKQFSYEFLEQIQETYECCDEAWYRANMNDQLPVSCFVPDTNYSEIHDQTCANALGSLISIRCSIIAACLLILLACLACLFSIDLVALLASSDRQSYRSYRVNNAQNAQSSHQRMGSFQRRNEEDEDEDDRDDGADRRRRPVPMIGGQDDPINELLRKNDQPIASRRATEISHQENQQVPLLNDNHHHHHQQQQQRCDLSKTAGAAPRAAPKRQISTFKRMPIEQRLQTTSDRQRYLADEDDDESDDDHSLAAAGVFDLNQSPEYFDQIDNERLEPDEAARREPVILARANLRLVERDRSQSPIFKSLSHGSGGAATSAPAHASRPSTAAAAAATTKPIKSALKKTSSSQHIDAPSSSSPLLAPLSYEDERDSGASMTPHYGRDSRDADADSLDEYAEKLRHSNSLMRQKSLQREQPTRRSLLSVRFAE